MDNDHPAAVLQRGPFTYSDSEWADIEASVKAIGWREFPAGARNDLLNAACQYQLGLPLTETTELRNKWRAIKRKLSDVHSEIVYCLQKDLLFFESISIPIYLDEQKKIFGQLEAIIALWETARGRAYRSPELFDFEYDRDRRLEFLLLEIWRRLGGNLGISRHPRTHQVQGPLAKYFFAAARPVMRESTPAAETLRDILKWYKKTLAKFTEDWIEECPGVNGEWIVIQEEPSTMTLLKAR